MTEGMHTHTVGWNDPDEKLFSPGAVSSPSRRSNASAKAVLRGAGAVAGNGSPAAMSPAMVSSPAQDPARSLAAGGVTVFSPSVGGQSQEEATAAIVAATAASGDGSDGAEFGVDEVEGRLNALVEVAEKSGSASASARVIADIRKRLAGLNAKLKSGAMPPALADRIVLLTTHMCAGRFGEADQMQVDLMQTNFGDVGSFMPGLKRLLTIQRSLAGSS